MADFYNSMGPLAALSLFGLMGSKRKKRGGMASLVEPTDPRSEKQDLGLGFNFRSAAPDPRTGQNQRSVDKRRERLAEGDKMRDERARRQKITQERKPEQQRLQKDLAEKRRELRAAKERDAKRKEEERRRREQALGTSSYSGLLT